MIGNGIQPETTLPSQGRKIVARNKTENEDYCQGRKIIAIRNCDFFSSNPHHNLAFCARTRTKPYRGNSKFIIKKQS